jgi:hypothetical protein
VSALPTGRTPPGPAEGRRSPRWVRIPAAAAPVSLIGGWVVAAQLQQSPARARWGTISELAAEYARHREVMTAALAITGGCLVAVAFGLRSVADNGRVALGVCGVGVSVVSAAPLPAYAGFHSFAATVAFLSLALWPALGAQPGITRKVTAPVAARATGVGCLVFVLLYAAPFLLGGFGIGERLLSGGGMVWVCLVVFDCTGEGGERTHSRTAADSVHVASDMK